jgi:hypothetical protein
LRAPPVFFFAPVLLRAVFLEALFATLQLLCRSSPAGCLQECHAIAIPV